MRTKSINFDEYDTRKLKSTLKTLAEVYDYNYDSSRKVKLLETVINKLENLINNYGNTK